MSDFDGLIELANNVEIVKLLHEMNENGVDLWSMMPNSWATVTKEYNYQTQYPENNFIESDDDLLTCLRKSSAKGWKSE